MSNIKDEGKRPLTLCTESTNKLYNSSPMAEHFMLPGPPAPIKHVIVPTGLGPSGTTAVEVGLGCLEGTEGTLTALHMVALPSVMRAYSGDVLALRAQIETRALTRESEREG